MHLPSILTACDPDVAIMAMTCAGLAQGFLLMEAPKPNLALYGTVDQSDMVQAWATSMGAGILAIGVTSLCLFILETSVHTAIGWSLVVWTAEHTRALVNERESKLGVNPAGRWFWTFVSLLGVYACFTATPYADFLVKTFFGLFAAQCAWWVVDPAGGVAMYDYKDKPVDRSQDALDWIRGTGFENMAYCVLVLALVWGVEPLQALGYMSVPVIPHMIWAEANLATKKDAKQGNRVALSLFPFWLFFHLNNFATLAFPKN